MPENDPITDKLDYGGAPLVGSTDFDKMKFADIEEDDLFWFSDDSNSDANPAFRKVDETSAMNTKTRQTVNDIGHHSSVYQKT